MDENIENLKKSFDEVGPIHAIIINEKTGKIVTGKSREKTGKNWTRKYVKFNNDLEVALFQAAENLNRRNIDYNENKILLKNIQDAQYKLFKRYFTQLELSNKIQKSITWVSEHWNSEWTHISPKTGERADKYGGGRKKGFEKEPIISGNKCENHTFLDATRKLLELRKNNDDNPVNKEFNDVFKNVPKTAYKKYLDGASDEEILNVATNEINELNKEPFDVRMRKEWRKKITQDIINEFDGHETDFIKLCWELKPYFVINVKSIINNDNYDLSIL